VVNPHVASESELHACVHAWCVRASVRAGRRAGGRARVCACMRINTIKSVTGPSLRLENSFNCTNSSAASMFAYEKCNDTSTQSVATSMIFATVAVFVARS
jgi:hypothetical protein